MLFNREKTGKDHLAWGIFYGIALTGFTVYTLLMLQGVMCHFCGRGLHMVFFEEI